MNKIDEVDFLRDIIESYDLKQLHELKLIQLIDDLQSSRAQNITVTLIDDLYKVLKNRQKQYDKKIDEFIQRDELDKDKNIEELLLKNGELTSIIWLVENILNKT